MNFFLKPNSAPGFLGFARPLSLLAVAVLVISACSKNETVTSPAAPPPQNSASPSGTSQAAASPASYLPGTKILFGAGGGSEQYRSSGWSGTEAGHTWTEGTSATLAFAGLPGSDPLELRMKLAGLVKAPELASQPVAVSANGQKIADWDVADKQEYAATIPAGVIGPAGVLRLQFQIPKAVTPKSIELNADPRVLGICVFDLVIDKSH